MGAPHTAEAVELAFKLEPGVAIPLSPPQNERFGIGGGESMKLLFGLTSFLDIGPTASFTYLPASEPDVVAGMAWGFGGGLRLKRPHDAKSLMGISPWVDVDGLYIRTGELNRGGLDVGIGLAIPTNVHRTFWIGPFVRYMHIFQPEREGYDNRDANILTVGLSFEVSSGLKREPEPEPQAVAAPVERTVTKEVYVCPDRDQDGIPDMVDRCPDVVGEADFYGCPPYKKLIVRPDKLELKEKILFEWDSAVLEKESLPLLDEVVQALKDNKSFRVQIEGHADSSGTEAHNQPLSEQRARAVLDYLEKHGIARDRLVSKGFASSVPVDTNTTIAGRERNRRVEFVVHFIILNAGGVE